MSSGLAQSRRHNLVAIASIATRVALATVIWVVFGDRIQHTDNDLDGIIRAGGRAVAAEFLFPESDGGMTYKYAPASAFFFTPLTWIDQRSPDRSIVATTSPTIANAKVRRCGILMLVALYIRAGELSPALLAREVD